MTWLLVFIPVTIGLEVFAPDRYLLVFIASCLAILPLAGWLGRATERLAARLGEGVGALLNATFGNAAELIIAFVALRAGLYDIVKASIAGCIVGNILLVLGAAMLAGGWNRPEQRFNPAGARSQATMLTLAAIALILPAAFQTAAGATAEGLSGLSIAISVVLLIVYALYLAFTLVTHSALFAGSYAPGVKEAAVSVGRATTVLALATAGIAWMSEILVGAVAPAAHYRRLRGCDRRQRGRARDRNYRGIKGPNGPLSLSIAIGSSVQIALFVAPVLVLASLFLGGAEPMNLAFRPGLVLIILLSVLITGQIAGDGRSDWLKGVQLLAVYVVLALTFYFLPGESAGSH